MADPILDALERASIIYNPVARNAPRRERLLAATARLRDEGWEIDLLSTEGPVHAVDLAKAAAAAGSRVVFSCGGDGTLNEVVNGLAGTEATLAVIRGGTGNVFAKEVGVAKDPERALRVLTDGEERRFDLGVAGPSAGSGGASGRGGRYFLLMAGVGFDGSVVRRVPERPKRLLGTTSYVLWGAAEALRFRSRRTEIRLDGETRECELYWLLVGNTRSYGGVVDVTFRAVADDGLLDAYVFAGRGLPWVVRTGARIALRRQDGAAGVSFQRARRVEVLSPGLHVQADGEYFGETPMTFSVAPRALRVLLPRGGGRRILSGNEGV